MRILVINSGSSSIKAGFFNVPEADKPLNECVWNAQIAWSGESSGHLTVDVDGRRRVEEDLSDTTYASAVEKMISTLWNSDYATISAPEQVDVVGHRILHGGNKYSQSVLVTDEVMSDIRRFTELAPLHQPENIKGIEIAQQLFSRVPQIAVFDTAFHQTMPESTFIYAGPYEWYQEMGIRRYGFHGISHKYCSRRACELAGRTIDGARLITCHLGGGSSLTAIRDGRCLKTTMGFTPLEGLVMETRCGSIDPSILLYLLQAGKYSVAGLLTELNEQSGLKGLSGLSGDMKELMSQAESGNERADLALSVYISSLTGYIGSLLPVLGGLDMLVFTGGIGEHAAAIRAAACEPFAFAGVSVDAVRNNSCFSDGDISAAGCSVSVLVVNCREDKEIASECRRLLS